MPNIPVVKQFNLVVHKRSPRVVQLFWGLVSLKFSRMKLFTILALILVSVLAEVKPIYEFPEWWAERDFNPSQWKQNRSGRIIGGQESKPHGFPYQVALLLFIKGTKDVALCGGSLITTNRVITAAHCIDSVVGLETIFGAHYLSRREKSQVKQQVLTKGLIAHEKYNKRDLSNDIAMVNLPTPVILSDVIQLVYLPEGEMLMKDLAGEMATAVGWGRFSSAQVSSKVLRYADVTIITNAACRKRFPTRARNTTS